MAPAVTTIPAAAAATAAVASADVPAAAGASAAVTASAALPPLLWLPTTATSSTGAATTSSAAATTTYDLNRPYRAAIIANRELCAAGYRASTRHLTFALPTHTRISYQPGDYLGIWPENDPQLVERLAARLGAKLSNSFQLDPHTHSSTYMKILRLNLFIR